jgi:hypothetical protein
MMKKGRMLYFAGDAFVYETVKGVLLMGNSDMLFGGITTSILLGMVWFQAASG